MGELLLSIGTFRRICKKKDGQRGATTSTVESTKDAGGSHLELIDELERHTGRQGALQHLAGIHVVCLEQRKKDGRCGVEGREREKREKEKKERGLLKKKRIESLLVPCDKTEKGDRHANYS